MILRDRSPIQAPVVITVATTALSELVMSTETCHRAPSSLAPVNRYAAVIVSSTFTSRR